MARLGAGLLMAAVVVVIAAGCGGASATTQAEAAPEAESGTPASFTLPAVSREHPYNCGRADGRCAIEYLVGLTRTYGARASLGMLAILERKHALAAAIDEHQLAHAIGRETAQAFGVDARAFDLCTNEFNYGCVHGFFEYALARAASARDAAVSICDSASNPTLNWRFNCYHGVGHGVMMAKAYALHPALDTCDVLGDAVANGGCWQGVFMENVNAAMKDEARPGVFSRTKPLQPCTTLASKYQHQCYINHAGWLMDVTKLDLGAAARICLGAPPSAVSVCAQSLGLMVTNPTWQVSLAPTLVGKPSAQIAWRLCLRFPRQLQRDCVVAGLDNIANFDDLNVARADRFCALVAAAFRGPCYRQIGINLSRRVTTRDEAEERCGAVAAAGRAECRIGANVVGPAPPPPTPLRPSTTTTEAPKPQAPVKGAIVVKVTDDGFSPSKVTLKRGQTISFVNASKDYVWPASNPHPIHTNYGGFDPGRSIAPGDSWSFTFKRRGQWGFHNHLDPPAIGMVTVR